jgi:hypothetical protein
MLLTYVKKPVPVTVYKSNAHCANFFKQRELDNEEWKRVVQTTKEKFPVGTKVRHLLSNRILTVDGYYEVPYTASRDTLGNPRTLSLKGDNGVAWLSQSMNEVMHVDPTCNESKTCC